jgi:hypothetical protein
MRLMDDLASVNVDSFSTAARESATEVARAIRAETNRFVRWLYRPEVPLDITLLVGLRVTSGLEMNDAARRALDATDPAALAHLVVRGAWHTTASRFLDLAAYERGIIQLVGGFGEWQWKWEMALSSYVFPNFSVEREASLFGRAVAAGLMKDPAPVERCLSILRGEQSFDPASAKKDAAACRRGARDSSMYWVVFPPEWLVHVAQGRLTASEVLALVPDDRAKRVASMLLAARSSGCDALGFDPHTDALVKRLLPEEDLQYLSALRAAKTPGSPADS